jgi:DNA modification methylase
MKPYYKTDSCALYQCDNLELMKFLPDNYIDLIYCDILYNTGKKFEDYNDNLGTPQEAVLWYEPRIIEMKRIIKETGIICLQMDYRLSHYLKVKMDDILGYNNFINEIIWCYRGGGVSKKSFAKKHDTILVYSKNNKKYDFNIQYAEYSDASKKLITDRKGERIDGSKIDLERGCHMNDWWSDINALQTWSAERLGYDTQKPNALIKRLIDAFAGENKIVADFFMGSGVTGEVSLETKNKFIGCDIGQKACEISQKRIESWVKTQ